MTIHTLFSTGIKSDNIDLGDIMKGCSSALCLISASIILFSGPAVVGQTPGQTVGPDPIIGKLHYVPSGMFTQGSPTVEPCRDTNEAGFTHVLTKPIAVMELEVTRQMWADLKGLQPALVEDPSNPAICPGMSHPADRVSWYEALLFANLLSQQNGLTPCYYKDADFVTVLNSTNYTTGSFYCNFFANGYRLPTEGEWEYFCRAGTTTPFWIDEPSYNSGNCSTSPSGLFTQVETMAWFLANSPTSAQAAGGKAPNPWNLKDVSGNIFEWCWDWQNATYPTGAVTDYCGPSSGTFRVLRGGAWDAHAYCLRSAFRWGNDPASHYNSHGFRLVRNVTPPGVGPDPIVGRMCYMPPGSFTQGSPSSEACRNDAESQFQHSLTLPFASMETEVTHVMWSSLKALQPSLIVNPSNFAYSPGSTGPVNNISWFEAVLFANILSTQNGFTPCYYKDPGFADPVTATNYNTGDFYCDFEANGYRLPTEGEWEYMCRAETTTEFSIPEPDYSSGTCGNCSPSPALNALTTVAWFCINTNNARPVGQKTSNPWKLRDIHGNVWEWCWDAYATYPTGSVTDYRGPSSASSRILRSGGFLGPASNMRSAIRGWNTPDYRFVDYGFRLVRTLDPPVADFNDDGITDILWRQDSSGTLSAWTMSSLSPKETLFMGGISDTDWQVAGVGDVDGDRHCDILWKHGLTGTLSVWLVDEGGYRGDMSPGAVDPSWKIVGMHDADGDRKADIYWRNDTNGMMSLWFMNESGLRGTGFIGGIGSTDWKVMGIADFDGDAKGDIFWRRFSIGTMSVWFVDEYGYAGNMSPGTVDMSWEIIGFGDADGDRKADLFWRNDTSGMLSLWFLNETGVKGIAFVGGISDPDWKVVGVGDFNGDQKSDILWRQLSTGALSVWFVNEYGYSGNMSPGTVDSSWVTLNHVLFAGGM